MVDQIRSFDKEKRLIKKIGELPKEVLEKAEQILSKLDIWPLSKNYDLIIIDGPARTSQSTLQIARQADLIIQPTGASRADLQPAVKEFHALKAAGINPKKLLFVINRVASLAEEKAAQNYLSQTGYQVVSLPLYEKSSYREAQNRGQSIANVRYKNLSHQRVGLLAMINFVHACGFHLRDDKNNEILLKQWEKLLLEIATAQSEALAVELVKAHLLLEIIGS
ncbi:10771_t:CDS:2 [Racocetra persica]|uniref:10771_t:CDS:1 n=2 Tax=Racocetra persica TaxID=160502 RepID=A0ACA9MBR3_9GLOM|nr:10771_t:CDS:2 [Racocetra persica]